MTRDVVSGTDSSRTFGRDLSKCSRGAAFRKERRDTATIRTRITMTTRQQLHTLQYRRTDSPPHVCSPTVVPQKTSLASVHGGGAGKSHQGIVGVTALTAAAKKKERKENEPWAWTGLMVRSSQVLETKERVRWTDAESVARLHEQWVQQGTQRLSSSHDAGRSTRAALRSRDNLSDGRSKLASKLATGTCRKRTVGIAQSNATPAPGESCREKSQQEEVETSKPEKEQQEVKEEEKNVKTKDVEDDMSVEHPGVGRSWRLEAHLHMSSLTRPTHGRKDCPKRAELQLNDCGKDSNASSEEKQKGDGKERIRARVKASPRVDRQVGTAWTRLGIGPKVDGAGTGPALSPARERRGRAQKSRKQAFWTCRTMTRTWHARESGNYLQESCRCHLRR